MKRSSSKFILGRDELVYDGEFIKVLRRNFRNRDTGEAGAWEMVQRGANRRIVSILGITPKNEAILVKQFRLPFKTWIIELCAGLADKRGEREEDLARRELLEETGYTVTRLKKLVTGPFNAGLLHDEIVTFVGFGARKVQEPELEFSEDIEVLKVSLKKLPFYLLHPKKGVKVDMKIWSALYFLQKNHRRLIS